ncbi:hypothetical protein H9Q16_16435 [Sulfitobacter sp. TSTF-M16]|uniref:Flagellar biosynthesis protein n=1 Tax=Sulfitobacter aestuariivivens TaxID=2766981 RepID=A0A927D8G9_9RHOB|nr:hypothetical protein [Sulfitobacter aestuariivivens]MBD3665522.1 hypothetical protein [Sulfitobacter aestuariivivens]
MPSLSHRYRDFGASEDGASLAVEGAHSAADEDAELEAFDTGYRAGWEDAVKALEGGTDAAARGIAQTLQDMAFTLREATAHLHAAMQPLMQQIVNKLLPKIARPVIGAQIIEQIGLLTEQTAEYAIEITVAEDSLEGLQDLLGDQTIGPFTLAGDPKLRIGQAYLRVNQTEREINFDAVLAGISEAFDAFYDQMKEPHPND